MSDDDSNELVYVCKKRLSYKKKKRMPIFGILIGSLYLVVMAGVFYCEEEEEEEVS